MNGKMTKHKQVKEHLETKGSITSMEAFELYGATRLSAIIFVLRHNEGMKIKNDWVVKKDKNDNPCRYVKYYLDKE